MHKIFIRFFATVVFIVVATLGAFAASEYKNYTPSVLESAQQSGKPYLLDFYATWCSTCRTQDRVLGQLQDEDAKYKNVQIIRVDWDSGASQALIAKHRIPRRSTLVIFKGEKELGRVVAQTSVGKIRDLLELGL